MESYKKMNEIFFFLWRWRFSERKKVGGRGGGEGGSVTGCCISSFFSFYSSLLFLSSFIILDVTRTFYFCYFFLFSLPFRHPFFIHKNAIFAVFAGLKSYSIICTILCLSHFFFSYFSHLLSYLVLYSHIYFSYLFSFFISFFLDFFNLKSFPPIPGVLIITFTFIY